MIIKISDICNKVCHVLRKNYFDITNIDVDINNINNREDTTTEQSTDTTAISDRILNTGYTTSAEADSTITTDYITTTTTTTTDRISETLYPASVGTSPTISHTDVDTTMQGTDRINNTVNNTITEVVELLFFFSVTFSQ